MRCLSISPSIQDVTYNVSSQPTEVEYSAFSSQWSITNTYAKTKQLLSRSAVGETWDFSFAAAGKLSSVKSDISLQTRSFDVYGRLGAVRDGRPSDGQYSNVLEAILSYDSRGRISAQQTDGGNSIYLYDFTDTFNYDDANRLTGWQRTGTGATTASYAYDAACNITTATVPGVTTGYTYDADNRLTASVTGTETTTYTNDLYGRRTGVTRGQESAAYTWDALGHLTQIVSEETTITYAYGITGMREYKSVEASGAPVAWTKSVYDGQQLAAELDSDGTRYTYVWGPDRTPLALKVTSGASSVTYAYHTDALGNVVAITSPTGGVVASYRYGPYGRVTHVGGSDLALAERNPIRYRSYYHDAETGFCYLPARYYDPDTMRFLSADPAAPSAGDPLSLNRYAYCVGDPVDYVDSNGARHECGSGSAGRVSEDAEELAKSGHLDDAKAVQDVYRESVSESYAAGLDYEQAGIVAGIHAENAANEIWAFIENELKLDRYENAQTILQVAACLGAVALMLTPVGAAMAITYFIGAASVGYLGFGAARAAGGDEDYTWKRLAFDGALTAATFGVGTSVGVAATRAGYETAARVGTVAYTYADVTMQGVAGSSDW